MEDVEGQAGQADQGGTAAQVGWEALGIRGLRRITRMDSRTRLITITPAASADHPEVQEDRGGMAGAGTAARTGGSRSTCGAEIPR